MPGNDNNGQSADSAGSIDSFLMQLLQMILQFLMKDATKGTDNKSPGGGPAGGAKSMLANPVVGLSNNRSTVPGNSGLGSGSGMDDPHLNTLISQAAKSTGLPANLIKGVVYAESSGDPNSVSNNPDGQHRDLGYMQISNYTYGDVMANQPNAPRNLDAANPNDNVMMGAWELKDKIERYGSVRVGLKAYVGAGDTEAYASRVISFMNDLNKGRPLPA